MVSNIFNQGNKETEATAEQLVEVLNISSRKQGQGPDNSVDHAIGEDLAPGPS
jgi:hypothetical protein